MTPNPIQIPARQPDLVSRTLASWINPIEMQRAAPRSVNGETVYCKKTGLSAIIQPASKPERLPPSLAPRLAAASTTHNPMPI